MTFLGMIFRPKLPLQVVMCCVGRGTGVGVLCELVERRFLYHVATQGAVRGEFFRYVERVVLLGGCQDVAPARGGDGRAAADVMKTAIVE